MILGKDVTKVLNWHGQTSADLLFSKAIGDAAPVHVMLAELPPPQQGTQAKFVNCDADIVFFGGAAGGGKSFGLLLDCAKSEYLLVPGYNAVVFRRTRPDITNEGGIWDTADAIYPEIDGQANRTYLSWTFKPHNARVRFSHLQHEKDIYRWKSAQIVHLCFEELTEFTEKQFFYMLSRNRSTCGVKPKLRATMNPLADSWISRFIQWWWDEATGYPIPERSGIIRYFFRHNEETHWANTPDELVAQFAEQIAEILHKLNTSVAQIGGEPVQARDLIKSFTFISSTVYDNPELLRADPQYLANLMAQHPVEQERLLKGNWKVRYEAGTIFSRTWFEVRDDRSIPDGREYRCWDIAATAAEVATKQSFYTAGVKGLQTDKVLFVTDLVYAQISPGEVPNYMRRIAEQDGEDVFVRWELEGGSAGKITAHIFHDALVGFNKEEVKPIGDKVTRALGWATKASDGRVILLRARWNDQFLNACQDFDGSRKPLINDIIDATSLLDDVTSLGIIPVRRKSSKEKYQPFGSPINLGRS